MRKQTTKRAAKIISEYVLTPVIYYIDCGYKADFICFFEQGIDEEAVATAERLLTSELEVPSQIIDIREFLPADAAEVIKNAQLIYSDEPDLEKVFETAVMAELQLQNTLKSVFVERRSSTGTFYLQ